MNQPNRIITYTVDIKTAPLAPGLSHVTILETVSISELVEFIELDRSFIQNPCCEIPIASHDDMPDALSMIRDSFRLPRALVEPDPEPKTPDSILVDHLLDVVADLKSQISDAQTELDEFAVKLGQSQAREQIAGDRFKVENQRRRDLESQVEQLKREIEHEKLARAAVSDRVVARGRDMIRLSDLYNDVRAAHASLTLQRRKAEAKIETMRAKLSARLNDGDGSILIRELLADLEGDQPQWSPLHLT